MLIGISAYAQFPTSQTLGSPTTTTLIKGVAATQYGLVIQSSYADTSAINSNTTLDNIAGVMVRTTDGLIWVRSANASSWGNIITSFAGGTSIFTYGYNKQTFTINPFRFVSKLEYTNGLVVPVARIETEADSAWFRMTIAGRVPAKAGGHFITQSDSTNRLTSVGLDPGPDSTVGFQALFTKTAASFGYRTGSVYNNASAVVKGVSVDANTKVTISGLSLLLPKLTTAQRSAISSPDEGLAVYDTDLHKLYVYDGTTWQAAW